MPLCLLGPKLENKITLSILLKITLSIAANSERGELLSQSSENFANKTKTKFGICQPKGVRGR
jgi:hypothetical protein